MKKNLNIKIDIISILPLISVVFFSIFIIITSKNINFTTIFYLFIPFILSIWYILAKATNSKMLSFSIFFLLIDITLLVFNPEISNMINLQISYEILLILLVFGLVTMTLGIKDVVSDMKKNIEKIKKLAYTDELTDLHNRRYLNEKKSILNNNDFSPKAFFILDIDNFKELNDTFGYEYGDLVLKYIANELVIILSDNVEIGRLGGDEFYLIIEDCNLECANKIGFSIVDHFNKIHSINKIDAIVTLTVGVSLYPRDGEDVSKLMEKADLALYNQKKEKKGLYSIYDAKFEIGRKYHDMQVEILKGLNKKEFLVYYQPIISLEIDDIVSFEALIRWKKNDKLISPNKFLSNAEYYGQIIDIDLYVLDSVCKHMDSILNKKVKSVSINLSAKSIGSENIVDEILDIVNKYNLEKNVISFEITETAIIENEKVTLKNLQALRKLGFKIYLDDFGTGYSSLNQLANIGIDAIKIDKSFIEGIGFDKKKEVLIKNLINIANQLEIKIIAEGIEDKEQLEFLKSKKCTLGQGYFWSKPYNLIK
ncbi:MAG: putative bifunctional diguanylate cyclase/phosphodiesterase [Bacillota bacterium]